MLETFKKHESNVRGYVRMFPAEFDRAVGSELWDCDGTRYIDFFCGAGTLNYGHNNPLSKAALLDYIQSDGIQHSLDTATRAKAAFLEAFRELILAPRGLDYRVQFTGPTGTNAVEAAIKLARKVTQRNHVIAFSHGYHGHSLGALALTANSFFHDEHYGSRNNVSHFPFDGYCGDLNTADLLARFLDDPSSGVPKPAAIILEVVQGEGGVNVASDAWLQQVESICQKHGSLLIVDDIQAGNGRTGNFFSFEQAGVTPDVVCLSKSIGGGLPMSLVLLKESIDAWQPGEHTGTFRGNCLAFVAATALLNYWRDDQLQNNLRAVQGRVESTLDALIARYPAYGFSRRGRGLLQGLDVGNGDLARQVIDACFADGLLIESSGAQDEVLKLMPALTISQAVVDEGLKILEQAFHSVLAKRAAESDPQLGLPIQADAFPFQPSGLSV